MNKNLKKLFLLLTICIVFCSATITVFADTEYVSGYLRYTVDDTSVTITGYNGRENEVTIPSKIAGVPVNIIASGAFENAKTVTRVNLPDTIMTIEEDAFAVGQTVVYSSNTKDKVETKPNEGGVKEPNQDVEKDTITEPNKDTGKDTTTEPNKDTGKDTTTEPNKDTGKDTTTEVNKDPTKDITSEESKDTEKDSITEVNKDAEKDTTSEVNKDAEKDTTSEVNKDAEKNPTGEKNKDTSSNSNQDILKNPISETNTDTEKEFSGKSDKNTYKNTEKDSIVTSDTREENITFIQAVDKESSENDKEFSIDEVEVDFDDVVSTDDYSQEAEIEAIITETNDTTQTSAKWAILLIILGAVGIFFYKKKKQKEK